MSNSQIFKKSKNDEEDSKDLENELGVLHATLAKKQREYKKLAEEEQEGGAKRKSKKSSKKSKTSKKSKSSKKSSSKKSKSSKKSRQSRGLQIVDVDLMEGGAKRKSKNLKKSSKRSSKRSSKQSRELPPALKASQATNKKISEMSGYKISPALIKYVSQFRTEAKQSVKDEKDFVSINKKILELFNEHFSKHGKSKVFAEMEKLAEQMKNSRKK